MDKVAKRRLCQLTSLVLCSLLDCVTLEAGTDRLSQNVSAVDITVLCDVTPQSLVDMCLCFGGTCCCHCQGRRGNSARKRQVIQE
jgi:hypothetical protein